MQKPKKVIGSVQRALHILDLFDRHQTELGTTDIARALGLAKSTIAGLVSTLEANGYLEQNPQNRKYHLGFKLAERAGVLLSQFDLRQIASGELEKLRDQVNESVNLAVRNGADVVYIERMLGTKLLGMRSEIGKRERIHSTALGKAILAATPDKEVKEFLKKHPFKAVTARTITDPDRFLKELQNTQVRGFALDDEENEPGGRCVAAAILDHRQKAVAAVSLSIPRQRFPDEKINTYGELVRATAQAISRKLGASIPITG